LGSQTLSLFFSCRCHSIFFVACLRLHRYTLSFLLSSALFYFPSRTESPFFFPFPQRACFQFSSGSLPARSPRLAFLGCHSSPGFFRGYLIFGSTVLFSEWAGCGSQFSFLSRIDCTHLINNHSSPIPTPPPPHYIVMPKSIVNPQASRFNHFQSPDVLLRVR